MQRGTFEVRGNWYDPVAEKENLNTRRKERKRRLYIAFQMNPNGRVSVTESR